MLLSHGGQYQVRFKMRRGEHAQSYGRIRQVRMEARLVIVCDQTRDVDDPRAGRELSRRYVRISMHQGRIRKGIA